MKKTAFGLLLALAPSVALGATATLLPNGMQQYFDNGGNPLAGGSICFYIPNTTTAKQTWQDAAEGTPNTTPCVTLDSAGRALIFGSGTYREKLFDSLSNLIWDRPSDQFQSAVDVQNGGPFWGGTDTGAVNAYAVTITDPTVAAYHAGQRFQFIPANTNTSSSTLNINSIGAPAIMKSGNSGPVQLAGGEMIAGNIIDVEYDGTEFQMVAGYVPPSPTPATVIPAGIVTPYATTTPIPSGWLLCNGQAVSRATYSDLFTAVGTTWGSGDGSTTFNVPDFRGIFLRGFDFGRGIDNGRQFASLQQDAFQGHWHTFVGNAGQGVVAFQNGATGPGAWSGGAQSFTFFPQVTDPITDGIDGVPRVAAETRPVNYAVNYLIKY